MKGELKQRWVTALTDGSYFQGRYCLRSQYADGTTRHCCLGVLCDLVNPKGWISPRLHELGAQAMTVLDAESCKALGIDPRDMSKLAGLNDNGWTFREIAEQITNYVQEDKE